jgi:hypothetical protein
LLDEPQKFAGELSRQTNDARAKLISDHPGRFCAFAMLPIPDVDATLEELPQADGSPFAYHFPKLSGRNQCVSPAYRNRDEPVVEHRRLAVLRSFL